jgi:hypothetical protein
MPPLNQQQFVAVVENISLCAHDKRLKAFLPLAPILGLSPEKIESEFARIAAELTRRDKNKSASSTMKYDFHRFNHWYFYRHYMSCAQEAMWCTSKKHFL